MFGLGMPELVVVLLIVVVVFGATRLPKIGDGLGQMITNFKKSVDSSDKKGDSPSAEKIESPDNSPS